MNALQSRREGFALAGAVLAMVLVGAIVTGGFYAAHQESRITRSGEFADLAQYIAETGLNDVLANTNAAALDGYVVHQNNEVRTNTVVQYGGRNVGSYTVTITKLPGSQRLFMVRSTGTVTVGQSGNASQSQRTVTNIVRARRVDFDNQTAMQVYGDLTVTGNSEVAGADTNLGHWSGCTTASGTAAVTAQPLADIDEQGSGNIDGDVRRQTMGAGDFTVFGDLTWNDLVSMATNVYAAGTTLSQITPAYGTGGVCNTSAANNWGAPESNSDACKNHFPIIYSPGNLHISASGAGQGILLVGGNLSIQSTFKFYGPIIVMGTVDFRGGAEIVGSVFAYGGGTVGEENQTAGTMVVQYSSCSIKRATLGASGLSRAIPIRNRSWMDLTAVQNSY